MKKQVPYIIIAVILVALIVLLLLPGSDKKNREFDSTVTLSYRDANPYGGKVAYEQLPRLFPGAGVVLGKRTTAFLDDLSDSDRFQLMVVLTPHFYPTYYEWSRLLRWVRQGNSLFIASTWFNQSIKDEFHLQLSDIGGDNASVYHPPSDFEGNYDSLRVRLSDPSFHDTNVYCYPGRTFSRSILTLDTDYTRILGKDDEGLANLVYMRSGDGQILLQVAPLAFSNYFLLYGHNMRYYDKVLSVFPDSVNRVNWNQYYYYKSLGEERESIFGPLFEFLKIPALRWAFWLLVVLLLLYVLLEMKRRRRRIPVIPPKANETLDFVKTVGRLYFEKRDHQNLAVKMGQHFVEFIRTRYQTHLDLLDESSIVHLARRSGTDEVLVRRIATQLRYAQDAPDWSEEQLDEWYETLETFYKTAQ